MEKPKKTQCFSNRQKYEDAIKSFKEANPEYHYMDAPDYENLIEGVIFFNPLIPSDVYNIQYKLIKGKAEITTYHTMEEWLEALNFEKKLYPTQDLIPADSAMKLEIGFLSVASKKIMRIGLITLKKGSDRDWSTFDSLKTQEGRLLFGKQRTAV